MAQATGQKTIDLESGAAILASIQRCGYIQQVKSMLNSPAHRETDKLVKQTGSFSSEGYGTVNDFDTAALRQERFMPIVMRYATRSIPELNLSQWNECRTALAGKPRQELAR